MRNKQLLWREGSSWNLGERLGEELVSRTRLRYEDGEESILDEEGDRAIFWSKTYVRMVSGLREGDAFVEILWMATSEQHSLLCAHVTEGVLFLGGSEGAVPLFGFIDLDEETRAFRAVEIPPEVRAETGEHPVDALVQDGSTLYVIDNLFPPRWLYVFDIANPRAPKWQGFASLPLVLSVQKAVLGEHWMAVLVDGFSHGVEYTSLTFMDRSVLAERPRRHLSQLCGLYAPKRKYGYNNEVCIDVFDLAVDGNTLWVAAGVDGVGVLSLEKQDAERFQEASYRSYDSRSGWGWFSWITVPEGNVQRIRVISPGIVLAECVDTAGEWHAVFVHQRERKAWPETLHDPEQKQ